MTVPPPPLSESDVAERRCELCFYAALRADPGPKPEIGPAPAKHWLWGGEDYFGQFNRTLPLKRWEIKRDAFERTIRCRRYPGEQPVMRKSDVCGEFASHLLEQDRQS